MTQEKAEAEMVMKGMTKCKYFYVLFFLVAAALIFISILGSQSNKFYKDPYTQGSSNTTVPMRKGSHVLIYTRYRSGSSFTGEIFNQHPDVFFLYEPFKIIKDADLTLQDAALKSTFYLENFFKCKFKELVDETYRNTSQGPSELLMRTFCYGFTPKWNACKNLFSVNTWEHFCTGFQHVVIKTITLHNPEMIIQILKLGYKVIHLVRDPRGEISSILKINQKEGDYKDLASYLKEENSERMILGTAKSVCSELRKALIVLGKQSNARRYWGKKLLWIRYEDIAYAPTKWARYMYKFAGIKYHEKVQEWIKNNTGANEQTNVDPMSTKRNSAATAESWRQHLPLYLVLKIQKLCKDVLNTLGYKLVEKKDTLIDASVSLVTKSNAIASLKSVN